MRVQLIQYCEYETEEDGLVISPLTAPRAMDDFDINIVDLSVKAMWRYQKNTSIGAVDCRADLETIKQMTIGRKKATVIYVLPQNIQYTYDLQWSRTGGAEKRALKDILNGVQKFTISSVIPQDTCKVQVIYEKTETVIAEYMYAADFHFTDSSAERIVTKSQKSMHPTTIALDYHTYVTTLNITQFREGLKHFIEKVFYPKEKFEAPEWICDVCFGDDEQQNRIIAECKNKIEEANHKIDAAEKRLEENAKFKSILYTNGEQLVSVVFQMLECILNCNLSGFVDEKREDFLVNKPDCTFIGEIKGVTSNVKYEHISQLELHYRGYLDDLADAGISENVKQLLIINPFRTKPLSEREPIHIDQINLAKRNDCLIVETSVLLRLYESFFQGKISAEQCISILKNKTGLLKLSDFDENNHD